MSSISKVMLFASLLLSSGVSWAAEFDHAHRVWDQVLKTHVHGSFVDYASLAKDTQRLDLYLKQLDSVTRADVDAWSRDKQLAFWINAYNAFTLRVILDYYPINTWTFKGLVVPRNSIIQIPGVWKKLEWAVAGQSLTLDHIEHGLIRPTFKEPRIHFAIVCASIGCPDLRSEAITYDQLEHQLEDQTRAYLSNTTKGVRMDFEKGRVSVSKLFKWFNEDFDVMAPSGFKAGGRSKKERNALNFIARYLRSPRGWELLQSADTDFDFLSYDWSLNELPKKNDSAS